MDQAGILFSPTQEKLVTTNAWAFLHALRTVRGIDLADWAALLEWAAAEPVAAIQAVRELFRLPDVAPAIIPHLADLLLFLDLRPDDVVFVADDQPWPWQAISLAGATLRRHAGKPAGVLEAAAEAGASIIAVPAPWLDVGSFQRRQRLDLRALRGILTLGGPLSAEAAGRIYAWVKPDIFLRGRAGDRVWGDPLGPVRAKPVFAPALGSLLRRVGGRMPRA